METLVLGCETREAWMSDSTRDRPVERRLVCAFRSLAKWRRAVAITHRYVRIPPIHSGPGGQTLAETSCCIRQVTRHRGYLRMIAGANVHRFGGAAQPSEVPFRSGLHRAEPRRNESLPGPDAVARPSISVIAGIAGSASVGMAPVDGARGRPPGCGRQAGGATRNVNVIGPSLVRVICMRAPKRPVSTSGCSARARCTA